MSKHTPAPWFVRETGDHYSKRNDIYVIGNPDGSLGGDRKLAMLIDTWAEEQTTHNARLIAAAPELLKALILARSEVSYMASGMTHAAWKTKQAQESLAVMDEVIKKATGE